VICTLGEESVLGVGVDVTAGVEVTSGVDAAAGAESDPDTGALSAVAGAVPSVVAGALELAGSVALAVSLPSAGALVLAESVALAGAGSVPLVAVDGSGASL
jgi:hypothetical protein